MFRTAFIGRFLPRLDPFFFFDTLYMPEVKTRCRWYFVGLTVAGEQKVRKGFTLIELLVVVLIIGILAAVAVPQYRLAVEKARAAEAVANIRSLANALDIRYMASGSYGLNGNTDAWQPLKNLSLDVSVPDSDQFFYFGYKNLYIGAWRNKEPVYIISKTLSATSYGKYNRGLTCSTENKADGNDLASRVCKSLCGVDTLEKMWDSGQFGCEFP